MSDKEWQEFCQRVLAYWWRKAVGIYGKRLKACPTLRVSKRMTSAAGYAYYERNEIAISHSLLRAFPTDFRDDTIPHELAHIIAYQLTGYGGNKGESHGKEWQDVCIAITGKRLNRCHNYFSMERA